MVILIISCIIVIFIAFIAAKKFNEIAEMKGHTGYFAWCFFLGIIGYLMVIALPDRRSQDAGSDLSDRLPEL